MEVIRFVTEISSKGRRIIIQSYKEHGEFPGRQTTIYSYKLRPACGVDMAMQMWAGSGSDKELLITWLNEQCQMITLEIAPWGTYTTSGQFTSAIEAEFLTQINWEKERMLFYGPNVIMKAKARQKSVIQYVRKLIGR